MPGTPRPSKPRTVVSRRRADGARRAPAAAGQWSRAARDPWKADLPGHAGVLGLHLRLREELAYRYRRSLPFQDALFDRWERARALGFGRGASVYESALVLGDVRVGRETWVGPNTILDGTGGLSIGAWCSISAGVQVYTHDTVEWAVTGGKAPHARAPVRIGDRCYVGPYTVIARGVRIGNGVVVGAHSFVNRDLPARAFAAGCPARVLGRVETSGGAVRITRTQEGAAPAGRAGRGTPTRPQAER